MASNVPWQGFPARSPDRIPPIFALPRILDASVEQGAASLPALKFPGCEPMRLTHEELEVFDGRLELWDARVETAWVIREPTSPVHERPGQALSALAERIAAVRGSPITCYGAMDLLQRDGDGATQAGHAVGPVRVPAAESGGPARGPRHGRRRARHPRCGAGGGPHDGCAPRQAVAIRGVGIPGVVGGGAGLGGVESSPRAGSRIDSLSAWEKTATRSPRRAGRFRAGRRSRFTTR